MGFSKEEKSKRIVRGVKTVFFIIKQVAEKDESFLPIRRRKRHPDGVANGGSLNDKKG